jgi:hypothetical protein
MKRSLFIIIATVLVLILIAVWVYLLFFRVDSNSDQSFSDLNFNDTTDVTFEPTISPPDPVVDVFNVERIRQLTTGPVVGQVETTNELGETVINYVEAGTGHVYQINLSSGEEKRISGVTFPRIKKAEMTPNGEYIIIEQGIGRDKEFSLGQLSSTTGEFVFNSIVENIVDFAATSQDTFFFSVMSEAGLVANQYYPQNKTSEQLFAIPFREAVIKWGRTSTSSHYVYPKASSKLDGYLYQSHQGGIKRLPAAGLGLTAVGTNDDVVLAYQEKGIYLTDLLSIGEENTTTTNLDFLLRILPDKCSALGDSNKLVCATDNQPRDHNTPDDWYRGLISYSDDLWQIDLENLVFNRLLRVSEETGRDIDIINLAVGRSGQYLTFQNKNDQTLWMFILPPEVVESNQVDVVTDSEEVNNI